MSKIGLIDVDGHNFPNLPLMKLSAWHKQQGDSVEWYEPMFSGHMDRVYLSKVFGFTDDYLYHIDADEIIRGGTGYCIESVGGREIFHKEKNINLPDEIEHIYPDYSLYNINDTAYGFLSRGCPRGCDFCHVKDKEGRKSYKVADLNEFWRGQKNIVICDPNLLACKESENLLTQLIDSKAMIDINQGFDIRIMTERQADLITKMRVKELHFAWDKYEEKDVILPKFKMFREKSKMHRQLLIVYVLCNFNTTIEQDLERIYTLRDMGFNPYVMLYDKQSLEKGNIYKKLQRWVNNRFIFASNERFEDFLENKNK